MVLSLVLLASCTAEQGTTPPQSSNQVTSPAPPSTTAAPLPTNSPSSPASQTAAAHPAIAWTEQTIAGEVQALFADGDRFVAVGRADDAQAAWVSTDGLRWKRQAVPPPTDVELSPDGPVTQDYVTRTSQMGNLVRLDDTVYAFGLFNFMDFVRPLGWRWSDGAAWEPITSSSPFYEAGSVRDVAAGDGTLIAARLDIALSEFGTDSEVWAWSASTSWVQSDLSIAEEERVAVNRLAWHDGVFLASGSVVPEQPDADAAWTPRLWQSADGRAWRQVASPTQEAALCALEADPAGGFVAVGMTAQESVVWRWRDGDWSGAALPGSPAHSAFGNPFVSDCDVVPLSDGRIVAILAGGEGTRAWWSSDGSSWTGGDTVSAASASHVAGLGSTLVLARTEYEPTGAVVGTIVMTGSMP
jgi:hypothetical protein